MQHTPSVPLGEPTLRKVVVSSGPALVTPACMPSVRLLEADPELGMALDPARRARAERSLLVEVEHLPPGRWCAEDRRQDHPGDLGLLVLDGLLVRRVGDAADHSAELLGAGDVVRPWQHDSEAATTPFSSSWTALTDVRLGVLDVAFSRQLVELPEVTSAIVGRAVRRALEAAVRAAASRHPRLEDRLVLVLLQLAERHGRRTRDGVRVELDLKQQLLGELVGAHRTSVNSALGRLIDDGYLARSDRGHLVITEAALDRSAWGARLGRGAAVPSTA